MLTSSVVAHSHTHTHTHTVSYLPVFPSLDRILHNYLAPAALLLLMGSNYFTASAQWFRKVHPTAQTPNQVRPSVCVSVCVCVCVCV